MENKNMNISFGGGNVLITIVLILLKAFNKITWSWVWVFAPIWIPIALVNALTIIVLIIGIICIKSEDLSDWFWGRIEDIKTWFWWHFKGGKKEAEKMKFYNPNEENENKG